MYVEHMSKKLLYRSMHCDKCVYHVTPTSIATWHMSPTAELCAVCRSLLSLGSHCCDVCIFQNSEQTHFARYSLHVCLPSPTIFHYLHIHLATYTLYFECVCGGMGVTSVRLDNFPCYLCMTFRKMDPALATCAWVLTYINLIKIYEVRGVSVFPKHHHTFVTCIQS